MSLCPCSCHVHLQNLMSIMPVVGYERVVSLFRLCRAPRIIGAALAPSMRSSLSPAVPQQRP